MGLSLILFGDKPPMPTSRAAASGVDSPLMLLHGCEAGVGSLEGGGPSGGRRGEGTTFWGVTREFQWGEERSTTKFSKLMIL